MAHAQGPPCPLHRGDSLKRVDCRHAPPFTFSSSDTFSPKESIQPPPPLLPRHSSTSDQSERRQYGQIPRRTAATCLSLGELTLRSSSPFIIGPASLTSTFWCSRTPPPLSRTTGGAHYRWNDAAKATSPPPPNHCWPSRVRPSHGTLPIATLLPPTSSL
jgi:hypothetical protein